MTASLAELADSVGLRHADTIPGSIRRWRIQNTFDRQGIDAAVAIAGEKVNRLPLLITIPGTTQDDDETAKVTSFLAA